MNRLFPTAIRDLEYQQPTVLEGAFAYRFAAIHYLLDGYGYRFRTPV
jgi:hypothetical protein